MKILCIGIAFAFSALLNPQYALARLIGTEGGNGGDLCEARIYEIRSDINRWIDIGGSEGLKLPAHVLQKTYIAEMKKMFTSAKVSCVTDALKIGNSEKTCINRVENNQARIYCNLERFSSTPSTDQYVLVHHEYAGLAGLEQNDGESSRYDLSKQISGFLEQEIMTKLAIKAGGNGLDLMECSDNYTRSLKAKLDKGNVIFRLEAFGFLDRLDLADKLGLPQSESFSELEIKVLANQCSWEYAHGRISCFARNQVLLFKNKKGTVEAIVALKISLDAGTVGLGFDSKQFISIEIKANRKSITETQGYSANFLGSPDESPKVFLCGRPAI